MPGLRVNSVGNPECKSFGTRVLDFMNLISSIDNIIQTVLLKINYETFEMNNLSDGPAIQRLEI